MPPFHSFRIANDRPLPARYSTTLRIMLLDEPLRIDGSRLSYLKAGDDPLSFPRRVLRRLKAGDNTFFPVPVSAHASFRPRLISAAKTQGINIATQADEDRGHPGIRVWRMS